jgi:hypothetical protein
MKRKKKRAAEVTMLLVEEDGLPWIYIVRDGVRIAKRGHPDTPAAKTWISLVPGWVVRDLKHQEGIEIEFAGERVH